MRLVSVFILLACVTQSLARGLAENFASDESQSSGKFTDVLSHRLVDQVQDVLCCWALGASDLHRTDLVNVTLGNPGHLVRSHAPLSAQPQSAAGILTARDIAFVPTGLAQHLRHWRCSPFTCQGVQTETNTAVQPAATASPAVVEPTAKPASIVREVNMTLEKDMMLRGLVKLVEGRSMFNKRLVMVGYVDENGEAYARGLRPNMVIKAMTGTNGNERTQMWELDEMVSLFYIKETIRLARYPMDFVMLEGVQLRPTPAQIAAVVGEQAAMDAMTDSDKRIAKRAAYQEIDDSRNDFPIVGLLGAFTLFPPILILALNAVFGWYKFQ